MLLTELSLCDSVHSIFKYVPTQGKLDITSKRNPLFSTVSVYEPLKVPKEGWGKQTIRGIPLFIESPETVRTNKHCFITGFLGDNVVTEKHIVLYCALSNCLVLSKE